MSINLPLCHGCLICMKRGEDRQSSVLNCCVFFLESGSTSSSSARWCHVTGAGCNDPSYNPQRKRMAIQFHTSRKTASNITRYVFDSYIQANVFIYASLKNKISSNSPQFTRETSSRQGHCFTVHIFLSPLIWFFGDKHSWFHLEGFSDQCGFYGFLN